MSTERRGPPLGAKYLVRAIPPWITRQGGSSGPWRRSQDMAATDVEGTSSEGGRHHPTPFWSPQLNHIKHSYRTPT